MGGPDVATDLTSPPATRRRVVTVDEANNSTQSDYLQEYGVPSLIEKYLHNLHRFAATVGASHAQRLPIFIADAITWRDTNWWRQRQRDGHRERADAGRWRHASDWRGLHRKWDSPLVYHYGQHWLHRASAKDWSSTRPAFIESAFAMIGCQRSLKEQREPPEPEHARKRARVVIDPPVQWEKSVNQAVPIEILGDSAVVVAWINGTAQVDTWRFIPAVSNIMEILHTSWTTEHIVPRLRHLPWCRHVYRELNKDADAMATKALEQNTRQIEFNGDIAIARPMYIKVFSMVDGGTL